MNKGVLVAAAAILPAIAFGAADKAAVEKAIAKGAAFLLARQQADGHWSDPQMPALTALPVWALSGSGAADADASIDRGVKFVLSTQREDGGFYVPKPGRGGGGLGNYNTSVCLSSLYESKKAPVAVMLKAREFIASSQLTGDDTMAGGFGYEKVSRRRYADLSNTSYAMDAMARTASLEELRTGGARVDINWAQALSFVENLQKKDGDEKGGAAYNERTPQGGSATNSAGRVSHRAYGSMSYAAVLSMCSAKLSRGDPRVRNALEYCSKFWSVDENPGMGSQGLYYYYDIVARALSAAGAGELKAPDGKTVDWKGELAAKLLSLQREDGGWVNSNNRFWEADDVLCTSFAMLALELCK
ncbi:MAG: terpene cyclase/mutase family protein [Kiritimatiellae bacterium]|nr:terpene cyclase/mutase family protein [Kiritimatiellia bacterium]